MAVSASKDLNRLAAECAQASDATPLLIFAGAGISVEPPSIMPSVWWIQHCTLELTLPEVPPAPPDPSYEATSREARLKAARAHEKDCIHGVMAEIYYEILQEVLQADVARVWETLRFWQEDPDLQAFHLGPNLGHLVAVYLAWKSRTPIITTNFDTMFEAAARAVGLDPKTGCTGEELETASGPTEVAIWKVHGSVDPASFSTIRTTLQDLTRIDAKKLAALQDQYQRPGCKPLFIGYSGRDLDLFPYVCGFNFSQGVWVDPAFASYHVLHKLPDEQAKRFAPFLAGGTKWASHVIPLLSGSDPHLAKLRSLVAVDPSSPQWKSAQAVYADKAQEHVAGLLAPLLPANDPRKWLIHAYAMTAVGEKRFGLDYCDRYLDEADSDPNADQRLLIRALLLRAALAHDLARFEDSERAARAAADVAKHRGHRLLEIQALLAVDESLRSQYFPRLLLGDIWLLLHPRSWYVLGRLVYSAALFDREVRQRGQEPDGWRTAVLYTEHLIRLGSIPQGALERVGLAHRFGKLLDGIYWARIRERCLKLGYAQGFGSAWRYAGRVAAPPEQGILGARLVFDVLNDGVGRAIASRDEAEQHLREAEATTDPADREKAEMTADAALDETIQGSAQLGDASLVLKALVLRRRLASAKPVSEAKVRGLLARVQGRGYHAMTQRLIRWLCDK